DLPVDLPRPGFGPHFSRDHPGPILLAHAGRHAELVDEFDRMAEVYDAYVKPFSQPLFEEAMIAMATYLAPEARVLDAGCGAGRGAGCGGGGGRRGAGRGVGGGGGVGIDRAAGRVRAAAAGARAAGIDNCAFVRADVPALPRRFEGQFDVVYSSLAHHHYP